MNALTGREQRLIAIAILIALVAIAWLGIARPLISGFSERAEERQRLIAIHQRNEMLVARAPTWRRQLQQQKRDGAGFAITAPNSTLATEDRKSVASGKSVSVRVNLGGRRNIKKKKNKNKK